MTHLVLIILLANGQLDNTNGGHNLEPASEGHLAQSLEASLYLAIEHWMVESGEPGADYCVGGGEQKRAQAPLDLCPLGSPSFH